MRKDAEFCSAIWLARGKNQNVSVKRAMTFVSLARTWSLLAHEKDELTAIVASTRLRGYSAMDVTDDYTAQNLSAHQRDVMKLIVRALSNKEIASILNLAEGTVKILTAKECLQSAEACLALAHKTKELDTRAALLEFAYEFRTAAKHLERDEREC